MNTFSKRDAERLVASLNVGALNRELIAYWLSLWPGDALPDRASFNPAKLKHRLPEMILFDVVPGKSVTVRLAGTNIVRGLRMELKGCDWIAAAPPSFRAERLRNFTSIARGAIIVGQRRVPLNFGDSYVCEEILLPFAPGADGIHSVICHIDGNPGPHVEINPVSEAMAKPIAMAIFPLPQLKRAA